MADIQLSFQFFLFGFLVSPFLLQPLVHFSDQIDGQHQRPVKVFNIDRKSVVFMVDGA